MTNPFLLWIAGLLGIDVGFVVMGATIAVILGYMLLFDLLLVIVSHARYHWRRHSNIVWLLVLLVFGTVVFVLSAVHLIITIGAAVGGFKTLFGEQVSQR